VVKFEFLKFVGPGLLVTVGFIDPGNWASNVAAGSNYSYYLLWMVTLSTVMPARIARKAFLIIFKASEPLPLPESVQPK
jgi:NRAMP (natural resistance-associated macrophage protein)-like metal ion transporter